MINASADPSPARPVPNGWPILVVIGIAGLMTMLDSTVLYAALPRIGDALNFGTGDLYWTMSSYLLTFGGVLLVAGRVAGTVGHRRMFTFGVAGFTLASLLGGLAWSAQALVVARTGQGAAAAVMAPTLLPLLSATFGSVPGRNRALGIWTAMGMFAGTAGLLLGGLLADGPGWRWIFFGNALAGAGVCALSRFVLPEQRLLGTSRVDLSGLATVAALTVGLGLLAYALTRGARTGWAPGPTIGWLALAGGLLALSTLMELRAQRGVLPPWSRRSWTFLGGVLVMLAAGMAVDGMLFSLALYTQQALGFSAIQFGLLMTVMTLSSVVGSFAGQLLVTRGLRLVTMVGTVGICAGLLLTGASVDHAFSTLIFFGLLVFGVGLGAAFVSAQIAVVSGFPGTASIEASGLGDAAFSFGGALGLATVSAVLVTTHPDVAAAAPGVRWPAVVNGLPSAFTVAAGLAVLGCVIAAVLLRRPAADPPVPPAPDRLPGPRRHTDHRA